MKVLIVLDSHVYKTPDNCYWCKGITDYKFMKRYLNVFEEIKVFVRVQNINEINTNKYVRLDGDHVEIYSLPFSRNAKEYLKNYNEYKKRIMLGIKNVDCAIFRVPSIISTLTYLHYKKINKPYCAEVVADLSTYDSFFMRLLSFSTKKICKTAIGVAYVTKNYLQKIYPCKAFEGNLNYFTSSYSSIDLDTDFFGKKKTYVNKNKYTLVHTSNISNTTNKGQDIVIKALGLLVSRGYDVKVKFIGDSEIKDYYYQLAKENNVLDRIEFTGLLASKNDIRNHLMKGDFFILPTKMEGLPRSIIEAMAVGLPCISTPVAGIPELLSNDFLCQQNDYIGFANKIEYLIKNPHIAEQTSENNIESALEYRSDRLSYQRNEFYYKLYKITDELK